MKEEKKLTEYEQNRNTLISAAEQYANQVAGSEPAIYTATFFAWQKKWNKAFHFQMNELMNELGRKL